ncbi:MAG: UbiA family prenyltransferase [Pirellulaceae bacterium]
MAREADGNTSSVQIDALEWGKLSDWAQLVRLPNVFTLLSNCAAAGVVTVGSLWPLTAAVPTVLASLMAYWAGMILNDVVDLEADRRDRPTRPLAAGKISPVIAGHIATGMLLISPILILAVTTFHTTTPLWMGAAFLSAVTLSIMVRLYNSILKSTLVGPLLMGGCRALNILMVGCTLYSVHASINVAAPANNGEITFAEEAGVETNASGQTLLSAELADSFPSPLLLFALGVGLYILGITVYARHEEHDSAPAVLVLGLLFELLGLVVIGCLPMWSDRPLPGAPNQTWGYPLLITLIGLTVLNRGFAGVLHPVSRKVQLAVKHAILTLIFIDAAVVYMWAGPWYAAAVALLLLPALTSLIRFDRLSHCNAMGPVRQSATEFRCSGKRPCSAISGQLICEPQRASRGLPMATSPRGPRLAPKVHKSLASA